MEEVPAGCDSRCFSALLPLPSSAASKQRSKTRTNPTPRNREGGIFFLFLCGGFFFVGGFICRWCAVYAAGYVPLSWPRPAGGARLQASAAAGLTAPVRSPPSTVNSRCRWGPCGWGATCKRVRNVRRRGQNTELLLGATGCACWGRGGGSKSPYFFNVT